MEHKKMKPDIKKAQKLLDERECEWKLENNGDDSWYHTSCGEDFMLVDGSPKENHYNFCPHCGGKINQLEDKSDREKYNDMVFRNSE